MKTVKKLVITFAVLLASFFLTSFAFANNDLQKAGEGVRNVVGDAENGIEDVANGIGGAVKEGANAIGNGTKNMVDTTKNSMNNGTNYAATRTNTEATFAGMNATTWTWFVLAIAALAIVGLVWYYASQRNTNHE